MDHAGTGAGAASRTAATSARYHPLCAGHWPAPGQRHRTRMDQVDMKRGTLWIPDDEAKGGEDIHVSLSTLALDVLQRQAGKHAQRVFTYAGKLIGQINTKHWRAALDAPASRIFAGTICGTPGQAGWSRTARPCMTCKRWAAESRARWSGATRIWRRHRWPGTPQSLGIC